MAKGVEMYQLRGVDEEGVDTGELVQEESLAVAFERFLAGGYWKLSWTLNNGRRVRLLRKGSDIKITYVDEMIPKL